MFSSMSNRSRTPNRSAVSGISCISPAAPFFQTASSVQFSCHRTTYSARSIELVSVDLRIHDEALEALAEQKSSSISFRLGQHRQENVSMLRHDLFDPENLQRVREVQHFGDGRWFFQVPA